MNKLSELTRRRVISAYRFHCDVSPTTAAQRLVAVARDQQFTSRQKVPPGMVLELWATCRNPPRWAVYAAAYWLGTHVRVADPEERDAVELVWLAMATAATDEASVSRSPSVEVINMQAYGYDCAMCGAYSTDRCAVPWNEEPVREGQSCGGYASVCKPCHDKWAEWDSSFLANEQC